MARDRYWRDPALGTAKEVELAQGRVRYFEAGAGEPIVFVHGLLVNANLYRKVVPRLAPDFRCICLDLPLGSHELPMSPGADLTPPGLADLIADAIEAIGLDGATLVGNDTGGGLSQLVITRRPERISRLVLTSCDAYDNFPPSFFDYLKLAARVPGAFTFGFAPLRIRALRRLPIAFGWLVHGAIDAEASDSYVLPVLTNRGVRNDVRRILPELNPKHTLAAAERLGDFDKPVLIAWSRDDKFFPLAHADRLAADFPNARLEWIESARTFSPEDQPERLAELIAGFVREPALAS